MVMILQVCSEKVHWSTCVCVMFCCPSGFAITGGICQAQSNTILVEDGGLSSSYTIAHEIIHR